MTYSVLIYKVTLLLQNKVSAAAHSGAKQQKFAKNQILKIHKNVCPYACNSLTTFQCKTHTWKAEIDVNLMKFPWKHSCNHIKRTYFVADFCYLESLCAESSQPSDQKTEIACATMVGITKLCQGIMRPNWLPNQQIK